jgi:hypothetical protein
VFLAHLCFSVFSGTSHIPFPLTTGQVNQSLFRHFSSIFIFSSNQSLF